MARHCGFVLPILRDALDADAPLDGLALVEALWARMCAGTRDDGSEIAPNDPNWTILQAEALAARERPAAWREQAGIYGCLGHEPRFPSNFDHWLTAIWQDGTAAALRAYVEDRQPAGRG